MRESIKKLIERLPAYSEIIIKRFPSFILLTIIIWFFIDSYFQFHFPVGIYIGILAFLAAVMIFLSPEKTPHLHKAMWVMIFAALLFLEINSIYREKREYDKDQKEIANNFKETSDNLKKISDNLKEILTQERDLFGRQERLSKETLAKVKEREGALVPSNLSSPVSFCHVPDGQMAVYFAGGAAWNLQFPFTVLRLNKKDIISLDKDAKGRILVSAKIYDDRGNLLVLINKNEFLSTYSASHLERTKSELIVYDHRDEIALSVRFTNPHAIEISGSFHYIDGSNEVNSDGKKLIDGHGNIVFGNCKHDEKTMYEINPSLFSF